jgi:leucyl aminopeptidase
MRRTFVPTFEVSSASPAKVAAGLLVLPFFQGRQPGPGVKEVQEAIGSDLMATLAEHRVQGKVGDTFLVPTLGRIKAKALLLVGVGPKTDVGSDAIRRGAMKAGRTGAKFETIASTLHQACPDEDEGARAFAEGIVLGSYRFDRYKERPIDEASQQKPKLKNVIVLAGADPSSTEAAVRKGQVYGDAANWARDLVNTPALDATPDFLAREAKKMAAFKGLECKIWTKAELAKGGFGGIVGVGAGSVNEPRLIELRYKGAGSDPPIAVTGKGVTFDSGGLNLKDAQGMEPEKSDMGGAAAALAVMRAVGDLKPKINVIAAIPTAENMPGGSAIRPGDVLRHRGGKTSEVLNTDAEGRLILADALAYLSEKNPQVIIDAATLTGAAMVGLGQEIWAILGSDRELIRQLIEAGDAEGEPGWELPLYTEYRKNIESSVADVKNTGPRWGGAINAALFLREFVGDAPWAHMDVAGPAFSYNGGEYWPKGGTGSPARTIIRYIESRAASDGQVSKGSPAPKSGLRSGPRSSAKSSQRPGPKSGPKSRRRS